MRILLVEDEPDAARMLAKGLREQTFAVDVAIDGEEAVFQASINSYDLLILDVVLPLKSGLEVCRELRYQGLSIPILMLTARDGVQDRITGLDAGADDYLIKPFDFHELLARTRALLRRGHTVKPQIVTSADLAIDTRSHQVNRAGKPIELTATEYALLEYLARRAGEVVKRADIAEHVWDDTYDPFSNLIEVYIWRLRRKIDEDFSPKLIQTLRGDGYLLAAREAVDNG
jgi:DNA-binding response OmpR family regulator